MLVGCFYTQLQDFAGTHLLSMHPGYDIVPSS